MNRLKTIFFSNQIILNRICIRLKRTGSAIAVMAYKKLVLPHKNKLFQKNYENLTTSFLKTKIKSVKKFEAFGHWIANLLFVYCMSKKSYSKQLTIYKVKPVFGHIIRHILCRFLWLVRWLRSEVLEFNSLRQIWHLTSPSPLAWCNNVVGVMNGEWHNKRKPATSHGHGNVIIE